MGIDGTVLIASIGLFLTWSFALVGAVLWLSGRFSALERAINSYVPESDYADAHSILMGRVAALERWALRLNGSVKINFGDVSDRDYRAE